MHAQDDDVTVDNSHIDFESSRNNIHNFFSPAPEPELLSIKHNINTEIRIKRDLLQGLLSGKIKQEDVDSLLDNDPTLPACGK